MTSAMPMPASPDPEGENDPKTETSSDLEEINAENIRKVFDMCHARMRSPLSAADAEDAAQEVLVTVWRRRSAFRGDSALNTWIFGIARQVILRHMVAARKRRGRVELRLSDVPDPVDQHPGPGSGVDTGLRRLVVRGVSGEDTTVRKIVLARCVDERSFHSISEDLGDHIEAVRARYYRSLPRLRERLQRAWKDVR